MTPYFLGGYVSEVAVIVRAMQALASLQGAVRGRQKLSSRAWYPITATGVTAARAHRLYLVLLAVEYAVRRLLLRASVDSPPCRDGGARQKLKIVGEPGNEERPEIEISRA